MKKNNSADVVVIGAGVNGALLATRLAKAGKSVILLESGPKVSRGELVERFRSSAFKSDFMSPYPFSPMAPQPRYTPEPNDYLQQLGPQAFNAQYIRIFGGTSWHWAAQLWRFVPNDFQQHSLYGVEKTGRLAIRIWNLITMKPKSSLASADRRTTARLAVSRFRWNGCQPPGCSNVSRPDSRQTSPYWMTVPAATAEVTMADRPAVETITACPCAPLTRSITVAWPLSRRKKTAAYR